MSTTTAKLRGKGLTRAIWMEAALRLVDRDGLGALNIRALAKELAVTPMAAYAHFDDKEDLLDAMTAHALGGLEHTLDTSASWDVQIEQAIAALYGRLTAHPGVTDLIVARSEGERLGELRDSLMAVTQSVGLDPIESADALRALVSYVLGFVILTRAGAPVKVRRGSPQSFQYGLAMLMDSLRQKVDLADKE